jgi:hypothetical protein
MAFHLSAGSADSVQLSIFTRAMTVVWEGDIAGDWGSGWNEVSLPPGWSSNFANGFYFVRLIPLQGGAASPGRSATIFYCR